MPEKKKLWGARQVRTEHSLVDALNDLEGEGATIFAVTEVNSAREEGYTVVFYKEVDA